MIVVLLQESKNAGLGSAFASETTSLNSSRGRKASREKQLQKLTVILGIVVAVLAVIMLMIPAFTKWFTPSGDASSMLNVISNIL